MDSTPPSRRSEPRLPSKSASRLARMDHFDSQEDLNQSLDVTSDSPKSRTKLIPLKELLLLSPSPQRKSNRARLLEKPEMSEEPGDLVLPRRRCKSRASPMGLMNCASPRNNRRSRRRLEQDSREERDLLLGLGDENVKPKKRRQTGRTRKDKLAVVPSVPSSSSSLKTREDYQSSLDHIMLLLSDLIMWKDFTKTTLWFGFGSLCFLSSCFTNGLRWSIFSMISQMGLIFLAVSFFYNSISKRNQDDPKLDFKLSEEDIVRVARVFLPATNLAIAKTKELFSGDPSTTLKVAPFLLFGAEYGHLITIWRLCAMGFFISFSVPKLYSCYSEQISRQVECLRSRVSEAWGGCSHKKVIAASAATVFWNLSSVKTRIFTAFISVVIFRYNRQKTEVEVVEVREKDEQDQKQQKQQALEDEQGQKKQEQQALEDGQDQKQQQQQALVVV